MSTEAIDQSSERKPDQNTLFLLPEVPPPESAAWLPGGRARVLRVNRQQMEIRTVALDALLPEDHQARLVWEYVERMDLAPLYEPIRAVREKIFNRVWSPKVQQDREQRNPPDEDKARR